MYMIRFIRFLQSRAAASADSRSIVVESSKSRINLGQSRKIRPVIHAGVASGCPRPWAPVSLDERRDTAHCDSPGRTLGRPGRTLGRPGRNPEVALPIALDDHVPGRNAKLHAKGERHGPGPPIGREKIVAGVPDRVGMALD